MNKLEAMQAFCLVAKYTSFSKAARELNVSATMASRYIKQLEQHLGCLLLKRNTRKVCLTEVGSQYLSQITPLLSKLSLIESQIGELSEEPSGKLTISASIEFGGLYLSSLITDYCKRYPKVELDVVLGNTPIDLFDSKVDLAFRVAPNLPNASHIAQPICSSALSLWANPDYLKKNSMPSHPNDLHDHQLLFFKHSIRKEHWLFNFSGEHKTIRFNWAWASDNGRLLNEAAANGDGIIQAPRYSVEPFVKAGRLVEIMPEYGVKPLSISAVYPHRYELSNKVKTFVEMAKLHFERHPIP